MSDNKPQRSPSSILFKVLGLVLLLLLFALAGAGGAWFYANREHPVPLPPIEQAQPTPQEQAAAADAKVPPPIFMPLEPFTVTLADNTMERILHVAITVRLSDKESMDRLERYKPEVRSRVLMVLSEQAPDDIGQSNARLRLSKAIAKTLALPFQPLVAEQRIQDILFTDFVVQ